MSDNPFENEFEDEENEFENEFENEKNEENEFLDYLMSLSPNERDEIPKEEMNTSWVRKMNECATKKDIFKTTVTVYHLFKKYKVISKENREKYGEKKYIKILKVSVLHFELILMQFYNWDNKNMKQFEDKIFELIGISKF